MLTISDLKAAIADLSDDMPVAVLFCACCPDVQPATGTECRTFSPAADRNECVGRDLLGRDVLVIS